ncbi:MAG: nucleotidyltransferase family protein [Clostridia bacterium]|nr:nucleotidyltransferase family protein [Clostridia bacterium]
MKKITAVIMCSGLSRRMGRNKLLMEFGSRRMFEYLTDCVLSCGFYRTVIVTAYKEIAEYTDRAEVVMNPSPEEGASVSVRLGTENRGYCDGIMFFAADQPFMDKKTVSALTEAFEAHDSIIVPRVGGEGKNPVIFPERYAEGLMNINGDRGGRSVYMNNLSDVFFVDFDDETPFSDIDEPKDAENCILKKTEKGY